MSIFFETRPTQIWSIAATETPAISRYCKRCMTTKKFRCAGKLRVNANSNKIDIWLIYSCDHCSERWNRPIYDRATVKEIGQENYQKALNNDTAFVRKFACNDHRLKSLGLRLSNTVNYRVEKNVICENDFAVIKIDLIVPVQIRLDQLLSREFKIARSNVKQLIKNGYIKMDAILVEVNNWLNQQHNGKTCNGCV